MARIRIGCSGWNYRHWKGGFYPADLPAMRWFEAYASVFDTVEINNSFYRLPSATTFERWRDLAPPGFCFAVKANRFLTQAKKLKDCAEPLERMMKAVRALGEKMGPLLFQLPPRFRANADRLRDFLDLVPADVQAVFEFREPSWYADDILDLLQSRQASLCIHDMPGSQPPPHGVGPLFYVRFHGADQKYAGRYGRTRLATWAERICREAEGGRPAWVYFNNDLGGAAPKDAVLLREMTHASCPQPNGDA